MRVGIIGTGAISHKHAQAYRNIGYELTVCTDINPEIADASSPTSTAASSCPPTKSCAGIPSVDYVDVCTFPDFRLQPLEICAEAKQAHPGAEADRDQSRDRARDDRHRARRPDIQLGVVSQHRFDDSTQFLKRAIPSRPARQNSASRRLREVVSHRRPIIRVRSKAVGRPKAAAR